ncbi:MAG: peptide/nickel transport system permease protein [Streptomyces sp.]|nr:peptide/nickel transport system permease protein [Streptomyces sp.]
MAADLEHVERAAVERDLAEGAALAPGGVSPESEADSAAESAADSAAESEAESDTESVAAGDTGSADVHPARWRTAVRTLVRRPGLVLASVLVFLVVVSAVFPGLFASADPSATDGVHKLESPSAQHWFGTDQLGRDLFSRVIHGSGLTMEGTLIAVGLAVGAGLTLGVVAGFFGGWIDAVAMRAIDVVLAIPALLLALTIVTALGFGTVQIAFAVGIGITPGFARTTRAEVLKVKTLPYIEAARTGGAGRLRVLARHILPNSWGPVLVLAILDTGTAILVISSLSFLGFGAPPPNADWGGLISDGRDYLITSPWLSLLPGMFVVAVVFSVNHISRSIEELQR